MWEIYNRLIEGIPEDWKAEEIIRGSVFTCVKSRNGIGLAGVGEWNYRPPMFTKNMEGTSLKEVAECVKSWNFYEASVGMAAINAYYNNPEVAKAAGIPIRDSMQVEDRIYDPFIMSQNEIRGKKVTVIGHFPFIETLFDPICEMKIIENDDPKEGDYPVTAADYFLPESDFVYIGSGCFLDKSLPRFLELSKNAQKVTIVGPSTTMAPILFEHGIDELAGHISKDIQRAMRMIKGAENGKIFSAGQKVSIKKSDFL